MQEDVLLVFLRKYSFKTGFELVLEKRRSYDASLSYCECLMKWKKKALIDPCNLLTFNRGESCAFEKFTTSTVITFYINIPLIEKQSGPYSSWAIWPLCRIALGPILPIALSFLNMQTHDNNDLICASCLHRQWDEEFFFLSNEIV